MPYNIAAITRELQVRFALFIDAKSGVVGVESADADGTATNLATPENIAVLLDELREFTEQLQTQRVDLQMRFDAGDIVAVFTSGGELDVWDSDLEKWMDRLDDYDEQVAKAPVGDRQDILWSVTAPLLLGFFGGEQSNLPQQPLDAVTPFMLANQLRVAEDWRKERWSLFKSDLAANVKDVADAVTRPISLLPVVAVSAILGWLLLRR